MPQDMTELIVVPSPARAPEAFGAVQPGEHRQHQFGVGFEHDRSVEVVQAAAGVESSTRRRLEDDLPGPAPRERAAEDLSSRLVSLRVGVNAEPGRALMARRASPALDYDFAGLEQDLAELVLRSPSTLEVAGPPSGLEAQAPVR